MGHTDAPEGQAAHAKFLKLVLHLFRDDIERIDVDGAAKQAFDEDHREHDPDRRNILEVRLTREEEHASALQKSNSPQVGELEEVDGRSRDKHTDLVTAMNQQ